MVEITQVSKSAAGELQTVDVGEGVPAPIDLLHPILADYISERCVEITTTVRRKMELERIIVLEGFHSLNKPLVLLHVAPDRFG